MKKVEPYEHVEMKNVSYTIAVYWGFIGLISLHHCLSVQGTTNTGAEFSVGVSLMTFGYYLRLTFEPRYYTLTWTLDYQYSSDFGEFIFLFH